MIPAFVATAVYLAMLSIAVWIDRILKQHAVAVFSLYGIPSPSYRIMYFAFGAGAVILSHFAGSVMR